MSQTVKEARANYTKYTYLREGEIELVAEQAEDRSGVQDNLEVRAIHIFSIWHKGSPVRLTATGKTVRLRDIELRGQVMSMNCAYRFPAMAGEFYLPGLQFKLGRITGIRKIYAVKDRLFRDGSRPTLAAETDKFIYYFIQPDIFYEEKFAAMFQSFAKAAVKAGDLTEDDLDNLDFEEVDWKGVRPPWWKNLTTWLEFKRWARRFFDIPDDFEGDDKSGDIIRPDDEPDYDSDESQGASRESQEKEDGVEGEAQGSGTSSGKEPSVASNDTDEDEESAGDTNTTLPTTQEAQNSPASRNNPGEHSRGLKRPNNDSEEQHPSDTEPYSQPKKQRTDHVGGDSSTTPPPVVGASSASADEHISSQTPADPGSPFVRLPPCSSFDAPPPKDTNLVAPVFGSPESTMATTVLGAPTIVGPSSLLPSFDVAPLAPTAAAAGIDHHAPPPHSATIAPSMLMCVAEPGTSNSSSSGVPVAPATLPLVGLPPPTSALPSYGLTFNTSQIPDDAIHPDLLNSSEYYLGDPENVLNHGYWPQNRPFDLQLNSLATQLLMDMNVKELDPFSPAYLAHPSQ